MKTPLSERPRQWIVRSAELATHDTGERPATIRSIAPALGKALNAGKGMPIAYYDAMHRTKKFKPALVLAIALVAGCAADASQDGDTIDLSESADTSDMSLTAASKFAADIKASKLPSKPKNLIASIPASPTTKKYSPVIAKWELYTVYGRVPIRQPSPSSSVAVVPKNMTLYDTGIIAVAVDGAGKGIAAAVINDRSSNSKTGNNGAVTRANAWISRWHPGGLIFKNSDGTINKLGARNGSFSQANMDESSRLLFSFSGRDLAAWQTSNKRVQDTVRKAGTALSHVSKLVAAARPTTKSAPETKTPVTAEASAGAAYGGAVSAFSGLRYQMLMFYRLTRNLFKWAVEPTSPICKANPATIGCNNRELQCDVVPVPALDGGKCPAFKLPGKQCSPAEPDGSGGCGAICCSRLHTPDCFQTVLGSANDIGSNCDGTGKVAVPPGSPPLPPFHAPEWPDNAICVFTNASRDFCEVSCCTIPNP